jgi:hypothetical protein
LEVVSIHSRLNRLALLTTLCVAGSALVSYEAKAKTQVQTPKVLKVVHHWRDLTWERQRAIGNCCRPYHWQADKHTTTKAQRWKIAWKWYNYAMNVPKPTPANTSGVPSWFVSAMSCISIHEEYGMDGPNTSAGYFGFIYPPSTYQSPGPSLAATYGDSWLSVPLSGQLSMAYSLYNSYGFSPWSTAGTCGLA